MKTKTLTSQTAEYQTAIFLLLVSALVAALAGYLYFVNAGVLSVVARDHMEDEIVLVGSHVSELEAQYFAHTEKINKDTAIALGFSEPEAVIYASRQSLAKQVFTLRNQ